MDEKKIMLLNKRAETYKIISSVDVYASDKEISDSIKKACENKNKNEHNLGRSYKFALKINH